MEATFAMHLPEIHPEFPVQQGGFESAAIYPLSNTPGNPITNVNNYSTVGGGGINEHQIVTKLMMI